ncbi:E3 ubiquitin-protein ligase RMA1H1-like [Chenopodium quinoa]|uniref:E3 ubiquitin-protein ligase RMA n=1 Tax=Chenopodium quinoa TaxID=63459 RepID=A0A803N9A6_CHEQI|nr:E3 ubiquitin-protein ligase RMA1H1-like [Chenopodium quinoa]
MEQYCEQPATQSRCSRGDMNKWNSPSTVDAGKESNSSDGFDCNICRDLVQEPVVTFCGHLYCWPCIYRWIHSQRSSFESSEQRPKCPICKAEVSQSTLIPLYGRGQSRNPTDSKGTKLDFLVPQRPSSPRCGVQALITTTTSSSLQHPGRQLHYHGFHPHHHQLNPYSTLDVNSQSPVFELAGTTTYNPMIEMFSNMIDARILGNSQDTHSAYPNTYSVVTTSSARGRWHMMQVDRSLSRVNFFFWCCVILCLLLF